MRIVAHCPNGHRIKVKNELAGRKVLCPTCQVKFRIPAAAAMGDMPAAPVGLQTARLLQLAPEVVATLPRALAFGQAPAAQPFAPAPFAPEPVASEPAAPAPIFQEPIFQEPYSPERVSPQAPAAQSFLHPALTDRLDLLWCIAFPGGAPTEPMPAETMQAWLDSRQANGTEVVWRADWPEWRGVRDVFPEYFI
ncbi:MAG: hypothetical protein WCJ18_11455 [Planctomycetota bacterium]